MKKHLLGVLVLVFLASPAFGGVYVTGSVAGSTANIPYASYQSQYTSASLGVDLASILRLSYSYSREETNSSGFTDPRTDEELKSANATRANANDDGADDTNLVAYSTQSKVIGNSVDLQLILYAGEVFVPYITGGVIHKQQTTIIEQEGKDSHPQPQVSIGPNVGGGLGVRLNRAFTLKISMIASPGETREPGEEKSHKVWDKKLTVGLTYQL